MSKSGIVGIAATVAAAVITVIVLLSCTEKIPTGYVGVVYNMTGGVTGEVLPQGWHLVSPTKKVTTYSIGLEQSYLTSDSTGDSRDDESFDVPTSDGKTVHVNLEFSYRFDPERVTDVFTTFKGQNGKTVKDTFIKPKVKAWTQEVTAGYPVTDIFGDKRTEINSALDVYLREKFDQYGIIIDTVNFTNIAVDAKTGEAIQKKVDAQQELELAKTEAETARVNAESEKKVAVIKAQQAQETAAIEAETARTKAQGEADVTKALAEAEAEANSKIAASLTPELVEYKKAERWNGQLPKVSSGATAFIDATDLAS